MQILPAIQLRCFVKHYLWLPKSTAVNSELHIFGDGNPGIGFCCRGQLYQDPLMKEPLPSIFGYGQIDNHRTIYASNDIHLLIAVLQPFALSALLRVSASELASVILDEQQLFTYKDTIYTGDLFEPFISISARIDKLDKLLSCYFLHELDNSHCLISATLQKIYEFEGQIDSSQLTQFTGYSERYLEKIFKEHVGFSPKRFSRITRMLGYIKVLRDQKQLTTLTEKAYMAGFYDQSHLNHEFKKLTGLTPSVFSSKRQALALNLFSIQ